ncbi:MAG: NADPH-dependent FMN reductase [Candidatus Nanosalina sp.]
MKFLVVLGTSREGRSSVHPARELVDRFKEKGHDAELFDLKEHQIPFLGKEDQNNDVEKFKEKVEGCDGLILVTPEYNHSFSGELKNALDHLYEEYTDKPFMYITVSAGGFGGIRALSHLHDVTLELGGLSGPELPVSRVREVFDSNGELVDEEYESRFRNFIEDCIDHTSKFENLP